MIVRLPKNLAQTGIYVESVDCPSFEFSRRRFMLETQDDLNAIMSSSAVELMVSQTKSRIDVAALIRRAPSGYVQPTPTQRSLKADTIAAIDDAMQSMRESVEGLMSGTLDMGKAGAAALAARRSLETAPDLFLEVSRLKEKHEETYLHSVAVAGLMGRLAEQLDMDDAMVEEIGRAGILHDLGKLLIPNAILNKPGKLDKAEWRVIRSHPVLGYQRLLELGETSDLILDVCRLHHEALDGSGYPLRLRDDEISLAVRICTVCDVFDALTSVRPYKKAWSSSEAINWMYDQNNLFDRKLVLRLGSLFG
ncbi:HDIG domain-containing protein [Rhizobium sp. NFR07]|nr:HDIG domain-containing protein [Rhizobium sp. NFR07]